MTNLDINQFNPQKAELQTLTEAYKQLDISGVEDKKGYEEVKNALKHLQTTRTQITKTGKAMRQEALAFQKKVIAVEKELLEVITPTEDLLNEKKNAIDEQIAMEKRRKNLPIRRDKLATNGLEVVADEMLLVMDDVQFEAFFNQKLADKLQAERDQQERERLAFEEEKRKFEQEQRIKEEAEKRIKEAEQKAKEDAERQIAAAQAAADLRIKQEADKKRQAEEAEQKAKEEAERNQKVQAFFTEHNCLGFEDANFIVKREGKTISLFKFVGAIEI